MATLQDTINELKYKRESDMNEFNSLVNSPCSHIICDECARKYVENEIRRWILSTKITEMDSLINQLENANQ